MALISLKAAAEHLGLSEGSIRNLIDSQALTGYAFAIKGKRSTYRVELADVEAYKERCRMVVAPEPVRVNRPRRQSSSPTGISFLRHRIGQG